MVTLTQNYNYFPSEPLPLHLGHTPIYAVPYQHFDGFYSQTTDIRYISIGNAQYDKSLVSIKAFRYGERWSRHSEELPLHRVIDMTLFLAKVLFDTKNEQVLIPANSFCDQKQDMTIIQEQVSSEAKDLYKIFFNKELDKEITDKEGNILKTQLDLLKDRFYSLKEVLDAIL